MPAKNSGSKSYLTVVDRQYCYVLQTSNYKNGLHYVVGKKVSQVWGEEVFKRHIKDNIISAFSGKNLNLKKDFIFDGTSSFYEVSYFPMLDSSSEKAISHVAILTRDITQSTKSRKELLKKLYTDPLTKVYNKAYFLDVFSKKYINAKTLALCYLDLDNFKKVNDSYGHSEGDLYLKEFAKYTKEFFGRNAKIIRLGGDEFFLSLSLNVNECASFIEQLNAFVLGLKTKPFNKNGMLGVSVGMVLVKDTSKTALKFAIEEADKLVYKSKNCGKGTVSHKVL